MIVVIAGIKRSGSTAQYNMVRLILEKHFDHVHVTGRPTDIQGECTIVKIHTFDTKLFRSAKHIFTTDRNRKEVRQSLQRFKRGDVKTMKKMNEHLRKWRTQNGNRTTLHFSYTAIVNDPRLCIQLIATKMKLPVNVDQILEEFLAIKPPTDKEYDERTMMFNNHITKPRE